MEHTGNIKDSLRYKSKVADLLSRPPYEKEAALLKALASGPDWRIEAVLDAIDQSREWHRVRTIPIFEQAGMFGRLGAIDHMLHNYYWGSMSDRFAGEQIRSASLQPEEVREAFGAALMYGHYQVTDYLTAWGAVPVIASRTCMNARAMKAVVAESDFAKIDYIFSAMEGINEYEKKIISGYLLLTAIHAGEREHHHAPAPGNRKVVEYLVEVKGVDVNVRGEESAVCAAFDEHNYDLARYFMAKGADLLKYEREVWGILSTLMYDYADNPRQEVLVLFEDVLKIAGSPGKYVLEKIQEKGLTDLQQLVDKYTKGSSAPPPAPRF